MLLSGSDKSAVAWSQDHISQARGRHRDQLDTGTGDVKPGHATAPAPAPDAASWVTNVVSATGPS